jgi:hypothetical protein
MIRRREHSRRLQSHGRTPRGEVDIVVLVPARVHSVCLAGSDGDGGMSERLNEYLRGPKTRALGYAAVGDPAFSALPWPRYGMRRLLIIIAVLGAASAFASPAGAAPPVLVSTSHVQRHPAASWTLPPGVKAAVAEVATSPATSTDGYFFQENVKAFDVLQDTQTNWVYNSQLDPGVYYVHIAGIDEPCFYAGLCPVREFTQTATLVFEAPPPPPPPSPPPAPRPRYEATVRSVHPGAIRDGSRNWTYRGDTVRVRFRYAAARPGDGALYRVCYTKNRRLACRNGRIFGRLWDSWRLRIMPPWAGFVKGRYRRYVEFTWRIDRRIVARKRIWVYE